MNLVERVKGILQPKSEWSAIEGEPGNTGYLFPNYVAIVAAIPAVCSFIGTTLIGVDGYRIGIGLGLASAIVLYVLSLDWRVYSCLRHRFSGRHVRCTKESR